MRDKPVAGLVTLISAPAITAPVGSVTVPWIPPRKVCANNESVKRETTRSRKQENFFILTAIPKKRVVVLGSDYKPMSPEFVGKVQGIGINVL